MDANRFVALWQRAGSRRSVADIRRLFHEVQAHYDESHRQYHTPNHIRHCLRELDQIPRPLQDADAIELAIWFHDVIYDIGQPDNEAQSVVLFEQVSDGDLTKNIRDQVSRLIMATCHGDVLKNLDEQYTADIDLSSFGLPWEAFLDDSIRVRGELTHQTDAEFLAGHRKFVSFLLNRPRIYFTDHFHDRYEARARANIQRRLEQLTSAG